MRRLRAQGIEVELTEEAVKVVAEEGYDPEFGARPLRRTIQRRVDNELSSMGENTPSGGKGGSMR
jgi:ATP-dependent Clp protease ATP-binding subunit ClpC